MRPGKSSWIEVPYDWLDKEYSAHAGHRTLQKFFNLAVKPEIVNGHLFKKGYTPPFLHGISYSFDYIGGTSIDTLCMNYVQSDPWN